MRFAIRKWMCSTPFVRFTRTPSINAWCVGSTARGGSVARTCRDIVEEEGVAPDSQTETFVALRLFLDNWRWQDVPFYLRTGKRLTRQASEIAIQFRSVPHQSFPPEATLDWQPSRLTMSIHPDEGIVLRFQAKHPGRKDASAVGGDAVQLPGHICRPVAGGV